jgi:hypothetical protein
MRLAQYPKKKIGDYFNLIFNEQKVLIHNKFINKVCEEINFALNEMNKILFSCRFIMFFYERPIFLVFRNTIKTSVFYIK